MKKKLFSILSVILCIASAKADDEVRKWEGEVFVGPNVTIGEASEMNHYFSTIESKPVLGYSIGGEFRHNFNNIPLDLGMRLAFSKTGHDVQWQGGDYWPNYWSKSYSESFAIAAVGDWNFNRGGAVSPFAGAGIGIALNETYKSKADPKPFIMPRLGVSINNRFRVSVSANITDVSHNAMLLSVGYMFGGTSSSKLAKEANQVEVPANIRKLLRQSNACLWSGVGTLCVGVPTLLAGIGIITSSSDEVGGILGGMITGVGGLFTLSSVPLFIVSQKKKNEAIRLSLRMSALSQPGTAGYGSSAPGVGLSLAF